MSLSNYLGALLVSSLCLCAHALELSAWRGETVSVLLPEGTQTDRAPAPLLMKRGVLREVNYAPTPKSSERLRVADRVQWNMLASGPQVLQVTVPQSATPGRYVCGDVVVHVVDQELPPPAQWHYYLDLWQHPWAVARTAKVEPFSPAHYKAMEPLWKMLASAGQKSLTVTLVDLPWNHQCYDGYHSMVKYIRKADGTTQFDWSLFDDYVTFGKKCGLGPHIACYTMCPWGYKVSWLDEKGVMQKAEAKPGTPFFKEYWGPYLTAFAEHLKKEGWLQDTFISLDERSPEDLRNTVFFLKEKAPALKIAMAGNRKPSDFKGIELDCYSQALGYVNADYLKEVSARSKKGQITTFYVCCAPNKPNTFMDSETDEAFWCGAYPAMVGFDGLLRWAYNSWPENACSDATFGGPHGNWRSGDTFLVYPDGSPSMRFLELLNGIQQSEKFRILKEKGLAQEALARLASHYDVTKALNKKNGDFKNLIAEAKDVLNHLPNALTEKEKAAGWRLLWDGQTLNGWVSDRNMKTPPTKGWKIEGGVLTVLPEKEIVNGKWKNLPPEVAALGGGGDLVTQDKFKDFDFRCEFRLTEKANSGIKYFYDPKSFNGTCEEYQILDAGHPDATKGRDGHCRRVASLYDLIPAHAEKIVRPVGAWNEARIVAQGAQVTHYLNGVKVLSYERGSKAFRACVAQAKYVAYQKEGTHWGETCEGHIKLQDHKDSTVSFRSIKIRPLN